MDASTASLGGGVLQYPHHLLPTSEVEKTIVKDNTFINFPAPHYSSCTLFSIWWRRAWDLCFYIRTRYLSYFFKIVTYISIFLNRENSLCDLYYCCICCLLNSCSLITVLSTKVKGKYLLENEVYKTPPSNIKLMLCLNRWSRLD